MECLYRLREMAYGVNVVSFEFGAGLNVVKDVEGLRELVKEFEEKLMRVVNCEKFEGKCKFVCMIIRAVVEYKVGILKDAVRFEPASLVDMCKALQMFDEIRQRIQSMVSDMTHAISVAGKKLEGVEV